MAELRTVARPYAKAAFQKALDLSALDGWSSALEQLKVVSLQGKVADLISAPSFTAEAKADRLSNICGDTLTDAQKNFVSVLASNGRLALLPEISNLFEEFKAQQESNLQVVVQTAYELDPATQEKISSALKSKLNSEVTVETSIDATLLGGALIKVGDAVIDGSVKGRLAKLATAMNS